MDTIAKNLGLNHQWASLFTEELYRLGLRKLVLSPGGRSMSLAIAASQHPDIEVFTVVDERSAGFFALGLSKSASNKQAIALLSTSGTAIANFYPAILEASTTCQPLIVITSDLPDEESDIGVMQSFKQVGFYKDDVRWSKDFKAPEDNFLAEEIFTSLSEAFSKSLNPKNMGPVHLNCRFRKPLIEKETTNVFYNKTPRLKSWLESKKPFTNVTQFDDEIEIDTEILELIRSSKNILLTTGSSQLEKSRTKSFISELSGLLNSPLLADITSSSILNSKNTFEHETIISASALLVQKLLANNSKKLKPDLIIHFGRPPLQNSINNLLKEASCRIILVDSSPDRLDPWSGVFKRYKTCPENFSKKLIDSISKEDTKENTKTKSSKDFLSNLQTKSLEISSKLEKVEDSNKFSEISVAKLFFEQAKESSLIFTGNSITVRAFDHACNWKKPFTISFNRGLSGIDGLIASAAGFFESNKEFVKKNSLSQTLVLGDISCFHDLNSLSLLKKTTNPSICLVLNNSGGQIFSCLPGLSSAPNYEECFITKQDIDFESASKCFYLKYLKAQNAKEFKETFSKALSLNESCLIEVNIASSAYLDTLNILNNSV